MSPGPQPAFTPQALRASLSALAAGSAAQHPSTHTLAGRRFLCAVSGGSDSLALAHALGLAAAEFELAAAAVYVDHGLDPNSAAWGEHVVAALNPVGLSTDVVRVSVAPGGNLEARAREARYAALAARLAPGDVLLTAHHQEDQALTVLLQLLRGAGVAGLAAMPARAPLGQGEHWRPLLDVSQRVLADYVQQAGLRPIADPSNRDLRFDRNFLRHEIVPRLADRWPAYARTLARSAAHCAEALEVLGDAGAPRIVDQAVWLGARLSPAAAASALRVFLRHRGLRCPAAARLQEFVRQVRDARDDAKPSLQIEGASLRRFGRWVFAVEEPLAALPFDVTLAPNTLVELPGAAGRIRVELDAEQAPPLRVRSRRGGERFGPTPSVRLKHFFNERGVLPWRRASVPLVYRGEQLVAVADWWQSPQLKGRVVWQRDAPFEAPPTPPA